MNPRKLVLDAGPLIALFHAADPDHPTAVQGFRRLAEDRCRLLVPLAIVFEVYKWLLFEGGPGVARQALEGMEQALEVIYPTQPDLEAIHILLNELPEWKGTLEDACVALLALRLQVPVWTLNYRDLGVLQGLYFWSA